MSVALLRGNRLPVVATARYCTLLLCTKTCALPMAVAWNTFGVQPWHRTSGKLQLTHSTGTASIDFVIVVALSRVRSTCLHKLCPTHGRSHAPARTHFIVPANVHCNPTQTHATTLSWLCIAVYCCAARAIVLLSLSRSQTSPSHLPVRSLTLQSYVCSVVPSN